MDLEEGVVCLRKTSFLTDRDYIRVVGGKKHNLKLLMSRGF